MARQEDLLIFNPAPKKRRRKNPIKDISDAFLRLHSTFSFDFNRLKHITEKDEEEIKKHLNHIESILRKYGATP